jgi:hypothetical protein
MVTFAGLRDRNIDAPNGPQADLEHEGMAKDGRGGGGGIGVGGDVVGGEHEAVVDIAGADDVLVDLVGDQIPAGRALSNPVVGDLDRARDQDALAAGQIAEVGLGGVVAVEEADRPAVEVGAGFGLEALNASRGLVKARPGRDRVGAVRRVAQARDIVRYW